MDEQQEQIPEIDYLSKDYASFRRLMLDYLAVRVPSWNEPTEADIGNVIVEILAYAADYLSYYQDAVATEAYLNTARLRTSIKRHTRLLDYVLSEGCNARAWVQVEVNDHVLLPASTAIMSRALNTSQYAVILPNSPQYFLALQHNPTIFETMYDCELIPAHNTIALFAVPDEQTVWPAGTTQAALLDPANGKPEQLRLRAGDVLIFEEVKNVETGDTRWPDPRQRHAVRLTRVEAGIKQGQHVLNVEWAAEDAFPFPLRLAVWYEGDFIADISVARGNIVLADHGQTIRQEKLPDVASDRLRRYRPYLQQLNLTYAAPYAYDAALTQPANTDLQQDVYRAEPVIALFQQSYTPPLSVSTEDNVVESHLHNSKLYLSHTAQASLQEQGIVLSQHVKIRPVQHAAWELHDTINKQYWVARKQDDHLELSTYKRWILRRDLLNSRPLDYDFTMEIEDDRQARLRFGFGEQGRQPIAGDVFYATYRIGNGAAGNLKADTLKHIVTSIEGVTGVRNPLPAQGGTDPESTTDAVLNAPYAFTDQSSYALTDQRRCVVEEDYVYIVEQHPEVANAVASIRWMGGWHTAFVYVQRVNGLDVDAAFSSRIARYMEKFLISGYEVEIRGPRFVALSIALKIYLKPRVTRNIVRNALLQAFSSDPGGFFYPGKFTFGDTLYQSQVIKCAADVPGVLRVEVEQCCRYDDAGTDHDVAQQIVTEAEEIIRLDNDMNASQNGIIHFHIEGGL
jgi:hypothetical protein